MPRLNAEFVLCQDCLAVSGFTLVKHQGDELCECGGDWCGCSDCEDVAKEILKEGASGNFEKSLKICRAMDPMV